jgi:hypothetical protein
MSKKVKREALEKKRALAKAQTVALATAVSIGVVAGVAVALVVLLRARKKAADTDVSGEALFV